jgi:hypothetical protein
MEYKFGTFEIELLQRLIRSAVKSSSYVYDDISGSDRELLVGMEEKLEEATHLIIKQ